MRLAAIRDALDRIGVSSKSSVEIEVALKPWEQIASNIVSIGGTREDMPGLPPLPTFDNTDNEPIDVEVLTEDDYSRAQRATRGPNRPGRPPGTPEPAEDRSAPVTGEAALEEAARANREAGVWPSKRSRRSR